MRILAIETTERAGSVAAAHRGKLLAQSNLDPSQRTAQSLAPALRSLMQQVGWEPSEVELVAVTIGPGSFTGLRIGVTTAKTLAYAVGASILGINTLEAIAARAPLDITSLWAAIDAQRGQVVARPFQRDTQGQWQAVEDARLVDAETWLQGLEGDTTVTGPAFTKFQGDVPDGVNLLDAQFWAPTAAEVAQLATRDYEAGRRDDLWKLAPHYSRRSAAEEKWEQRQQKIEGE